MKLRHLLLLSFMTTSILFTWAEGLAGGSYGVKPEAAPQSQVIFAGQTDYLLGGSLILPLRRICKSGGTDVGLTDYQLLGHELKHSFNLEFLKTKSGRDPESGIEIEEIETVKFENLIRSEEGMEDRTKYGNDIPKEYLK